MALKQRCHPDGPQTSWGNLSRSLRSKPSPQLPLSRTDLNPRNVTKQSVTLRGKELPCDSSCLLPPCLGLLPLPPPQSLICSSSALPCSGSDLPLRPRSNSSLSSSKSHPALPSKNYSLPTPHSQNSSFITAPVSRPFVQHVFIRPS